MNEAAFLINIKRCKKILGESGILKKVNVRNVNCVHIKNTVMYFELPHRRRIMQRLS